MIFIIDTFDSGVCALLSNYLKEHSDYAKTIEKTLLTTTRADSVIIFYRKEDIN